VKPIRVNIKTAPLVITADTTKSPLPAPPTYSSKGILTVKLNLSAFQTDYDSARIELQRRAQLAEVEHVAD
jgi:hypothetical protein